MSEPTQAAAEAKTLPCPHCGGTGIYQDRADKILYCEDCGAQGPNRGETPEECREFWNRRAPAPAGQVQEWAVEAARQCFPCKTDEAELVATAHLIADCLPAEVAAAVRLTQMLRDEGALCVLRDCEPATVLSGDLGWEVLTETGERLHFDDLNGALDVLAQALERDRENDAIQRDERRGE